MQTQDLDRREQGASIYTITGSRVGNRLLLCTGSEPEIDWETGNEEMGAELWGVDVSAWDLSAIVMWVLQDVTHSEGPRSGLRGQSFSTLCIQA